VNNPRNKLIFDSLDPEDPVTVISSTEIILDVLNEHVNASSYNSALETMHLFGKGNLQLVKILIPAGSPVDGKYLAEMSFPRNSVLVAIERSDEEMSIPNGDTVLHAGEKVIAIVKNGAMEQLRVLLSGS
jgi:trk system potassium uptake protein TrkA